MVQVVFLNGPPGSGKDTIAKNLIPYLAFRHLKFAAPLKRAAAGLLDVDVRAVDEWKEKNISVLKRDKTMETDTGREHLIAYWEFLAARYGNEMLGRILMRDIQTSARQLFVVSDAGKEVEVRYVARSVDWRNCLIIRVHRKGCTFDGDNREYLSDNICPAVDLHNDKSVDQVTHLALYCITRQFRVKTIKEPTWTPV